MNAKTPDQSRNDVYQPILGGILTLAAAMGIGRFAYTPILPAMQSAVHITTSQAAFLASANYAGYLLGALLTTTVTTRLLRERGLIVCLAAVVATTALMASTTNLIVWSVIRFLSGLASAVVFVLASGVVLNVLRQHGRLSLSGWLYSGVGMGIVLSGIVVRIAGKTLGWRSQWIGLALLAAIVAALGQYWLSTTSTARQVTSQAQTTVKQEGDALLALLLIAYLLEGMGYIVIGTFLVAIVDRMPGLGTFGPSVWIVVGLAAAPSGVFWARLATRSGYLPALILAYTAQACGIALPLLGGAGAALISAIFFGGTFMGISTLTLTLGGRITPQRSVITLGALTAAFGLGQIIGPVLAGVLVGHSQNFGPALVAATTIVLLGGLLMVAAWLVNGSPSEWKPEQQ